MKKHRLPLTENETDIWGYILGYDSDYGYSPTLKEIATFVGSPNHQAAQYYLRQLEYKGYIKRGKGWRNISIIENV